MDESLEEGSRLQQHYCITLGVGPLWWSWCAPCRIVCIYSQHREPRRGDQAESALCELPHCASTYLSSFSGRPISSRPAGNGYEIEDANAKQSVRFPASKTGKANSTRSLVVCRHTQEDELLKAVRSNEPLRLTFTLHLTESTSVEWETVAWRRCLYIRVPSCLLPEGSKEGFVSLLEYAEETLRCTNIIVCLRKDRSDRGTCRLPFFGTNEEFCVEKDSPAKSFCCYGLAMLVRTFMFLGFTVLPPTHALVPPGSDAGNLYMLYAIE